MDTNVNKYVNNSHFNCNNENQLSGGIVAIIIIPLLVIIVNIVIMVAVINYRSRLRQKNVYIYVASLLVANVVFGLLSVYQMIAVPLKWEGNPLGEESSPALKRWWTFRKSFSTSLYLIMIGNIGILILAIRDGANIIAKSASQAVSNRSKWSNTVTRKLSHQRTKAGILIAIVWFIPFVISLITIGEWNCTKVCQCSSTCYNVTNPQFLSPWRRCSRIWTPMTNSYMGTIVIFWSVELIVLFTLIIRTLTSALKEKRLRNNSRARASQAGSIHATNEHENSNANDGSQQQSARDLPSVTSDQEMTRSQVQNSLAPTSETGCPPNGTSLETAESSSSGNKRFAFYAWSRTATKELLILVMVFVACSLPTMIVILMDIFSVTPINPSITYTMLALSLIYCIVCPFLLMRHLGGLKAALELLCIKATGTRRVTERGGK